MKKIVLFFFGLLQFSFIFAAKAKFSCDEYFLSVEYNDVIIPGDAIFVRLSITNSKNHKKHKNDYEKPVGSNCFASAYFCRKFLPNDLIIEHLNKYDRKLKENENDAQKID